MFDARGLMHRIAVLLAIGLAGCTSQGAAPEEPDAAPMGCRGGTVSDLVARATPSPDGSGWCCPPEPATCDCHLVGGWAAHRCDCDRYGGPIANWCDVHPLDEMSMTDEHGCAHYGPRSPALHCCIGECADASAPDGGP